MNEKPGSPLAGSRAPGMPHAGEQVPLLYVALARLAGREHRPHSFCWQECRPGRRGCRGSERT